MISFNNDWDDILKDIVNSKNFISLMENIKLIYNNKTIYPAYNNLFRSLQLTSYKDTKVVIIGQDPYHKQYLADGLAFSVGACQKIPPSLKNIFKELNDNLEVVMTNGDLSTWAKSGILLLNTVLTVEEGKANSHKDLGWQKFTDEIIISLNQKEEPILFVLWGSNAIEKEHLVTNSIHQIFKSKHPSPLAALSKKQSEIINFRGSKVFLEIDNFVKKNYHQEIIWHNKN